ncbi:AraC family transcriptional regulator [Larsenimonas rhizosphaerae]|uniref:AraC family transcriptional regulator n=1 Tax=Larsenimonas rhizosphaerae TaxID=2944682 RepID=A0AA42CTS5_9GAMM|nr:AraC family transcriptional regulator [Larsenimonas rhizosphaerae]MCM2130860.1 AraC family transcriptional regulator [Larsenimonas rhizosphaerae]MCX2523564.1 AraC family transcriptional regulator [Larsenimonas rhizosphaerae]
MTSASRHLIRIAPLDAVSQHHAHDHFQIVIGLSGRAAFVIDGQGGEIGPFQGCLVPAGREHAFAGIGSNRQLILDLPENSQPVSGLYYRHRRLFEVPRYFEIDEGLAHYLAFMVKEIDQQPAGTGNDLLATTLLSSIYHRLFTHGHATQRLDLTAIDDYIYRHMREGVHVSGLAQLMFLSTAHFSALFREQTGMPPYQYVMRQRLAQARFLLRSSASSLTAIAEQCGFANQSALSHAYRRHFGYAPTRERLRQT